MSLSSLIFLAGNPGGPPLPVLYISRQEDRHLVSTWTSGSLERHTLPERASTNVCTPSKHFCAAAPLHISHMLPCSQPPLSLYGCQTSPPPPPPSTYSLQLVPPPHMPPNQWEPPQSSNSISCFYVFHLWHDFLKLRNFLDRCLCVRNSSNSSNAEAANNTASCVFVNHRNASVWHWKAITVDYCKLLSQLVCMICLKSGRY